MASVGFEFSKAGYAEVLQTVQSAGYAYRTFKQLTLGQGPNERSVLIRHDIDVSLDCALEMAGLEQGMNVRATYFVMLRSPVYNLFSRHNMQRLREIQSLGHEIALHFDAEFACRQAEGVDRQLATELDILAGVAGHRISSVSLHQPTPEAIALNLAPDGVVNTYHPQHMMGFEYLSDSNRIWRKDPKQTITAGHRGLQILIHPIWWIAKGTRTEDCWDDALTQNFYSEQTQLLETERAYGSHRTIALHRETADSNREAGI